MGSHFQKFLFLGVVMLAVLVSGVAHPSLFVSGEAENKSSSSASGGDVPILTLPTLSADVSGAPATSATRVSEEAPVAPHEAAAVVVADLASGTIFFSQNADERWPLASVSKLMTAAVASDLLDPRERVTITASMMSVDPAERVLKAGDIYAVSDLLRIMLLPSNNVAAEALAELSGRQRFLAAMNAKAEAWGMANTYYDDPSGLSAANQSTANDLLALARNIYAEYPQIFDMTRLPQATVSEISRGAAVTVKNINNFAGDPDFLGGKTGYTDQANGNLLSLFSWRGRPVFIAVLGTSGGNRFTYTRKLLDWLKNNSRNN